MTIYRWFNGNHSYFPEAALPDYDVLEHSATQMVLKLTQPSPWVPWMVADRVVFSVANGETWVNSVTGETFYTAGTITGITFLKANGTRLAEITGLAVDAAIASGYLNWSDPTQINALFWDFVLTNDPDGALFIGSATTGTTAEENWLWNGYVAADDIATTTGNDTVRAGDGNDWISDYGGVDRYDGQAGAMDVVSYYGWHTLNVLTQRGITGDLQAGRVTGPDGKVDVLIGIEGLRGTNFADVMRGNAENNTFSGGAGSDTIDGRDGFDTAFYGWDNAAGILVDMSTRTVRDGFGGLDQLISIERVVGSWGADQFFDTVGGQSFDGGDGDDLFTLTTGTDTVTGGLGADTFKFVGSTFGTDRITDFSLFEGDRIHVTGAADFAGLTIRNTAAGDRMILVGTAKIILEGQAGLALDAADFIFG